MTVRINGIVKGMESVMKHNIGRRQKGIGGVKKAEAWGVINQEGELYPNAWPMAYMAKDFINKNNGFKAVKVRILKSIFNPIVKGEI